MLVDVNVAGQAYLEGVAEGFGLLIRLDRLLGVEAAE